MVADVFARTINQAPNDEIEGRGNALTNNDGSLSRSSMFYSNIDSLLGPTKTRPRDRSNRLLEPSLKGSQLEYGRANYHANAGREVRCVQ